MYIKGRLGRARAELAWQMKYMSIRHNKTKDHGRYAADFGMEFFAAAVTTGEKTIYSRNGLPMHTIMELEAIYSSKA